MHDVVVVDGELRVCQNDLRIDSVLLRVSTDGGDGATCTYCFSWNLCFLE